MSYQPYPRALYLAGDPQGLRVVVDDEDGEELARLDGFASVGEAPQEKAQDIALDEAGDVAPVKRKPGRPRNKP